MTADDRHFMQRALELAERGQGFVEPNPMVGCVIVRDGAIVGEGWHGRFGGPHAEVEAIRRAGAAARGATAYVTLEPCCTVGKTPPCTRALLDAGIRRVVAGARDPNPAVDGRGLRELAAAGVEVDHGVLEEAARKLVAPFAKLIARGRPWVIAKWAMTLDGKLATRTGDSRWISGEASREVVHALRGRVDAIVVGRGTVEADDPRLTARPAGPRVATRIVLDTYASLRPDSQLVRTAEGAPVLVAAGGAPPDDACAALRSRGVDVWQASSASREERLRELLDELGRRQMTNILVEGGGEVLGAMFDAGEVDEVHAFIAPAIVGGIAPTPVGGVGATRLAEALRLESPVVERMESDIYVRGRCALRSL